MFTSCRPGAKTQQVANVELACPQEEASIGIIKAVIINTTAQVRNLLFKIGIIYYRVLYNDLCALGDVSTSNEAQVIELLRLMSETIVYGDQHSDASFEYVICLSVSPPDFYSRFFQEKDMMTHFLGILKQNPSTAVKTQIIQSTSIIAQGIKNVSSWCKCLVPE